MYLGIYESMYASVYIYVHIEVVLPRHAFSPNAHPQPTLPPHLNSSLVFVSVGGIGVQYSKLGQKTPSSANPYFISLVVADGMAAKAGVQ